MLMASRRSGSDHRGSCGLKKLSRMGFLGGLVLCNFVFFFQNFWFNLSYVFWVCGYGFGGGGGGCCAMGEFLSLSL